MIDKKNITGIILAGGKSSRMGSDKGFLMLNGSSFMWHIIKALKPLVSDIIIVSNNKDYDEFGYRRVEDIIENSGPLAGLYSGLYHSKTELNLVLSCDVPLINTVVLNMLIDGYNDGFDAIQLQSQNKTMPLIALYKKECMYEFLELLENNKRRLQFAVERLKTETITLNTEFDEFVKNINTTQQLNDIKNAVEH